MLLLSALLYVKYFHEIGEGIGCMTYKLFGVYCTGCGSTRQIYYLMNGDISRAFMYNVGAIVIYPTYAYLYYLIVRWAVKGKKIEKKQAYILASIAGILLIYMMLRNIPIQAFDILRP